MSVADLQSRDTMRRLRRIILQAASTSGEGHVPSALSVLDILWVIYDRVLRIDPGHPGASGRDRFVLSKGHASLGLYAVLAERGFFDSSELAGFGRFNSRLGGHPDGRKVNGVEASTGSLGHGFPIAVGIALGLRIQHHDARVICLIGDGEANEGSVWEAMALASHRRLGNLTCIIDHNHSTDRALDLGDIGSKAAAFGWAVRQVDGHDHAALHAALIPGASDTPLCIVADTVKGHGCPAIVGNPAWHHRSPSATELPALLDCVT
jgi:transketolase